MNNLRLLDFCGKHPEKFLDENYMFAEKHPQLNSYLNKTFEIKKLLITIQEIKDKPKATKVLEEIFGQLYESIKKFANYSEFGAFVNACDSSTEEIIYDPNLLKRITLLYLEKRDLTDITPAEWIQALIDKGSSRKKGNAGEKKLIEILEKLRYRRSKKIQEFISNRRTFAKCAGDFSNVGIQSNFGEKIGTRNQNKKLDLVIKRVSHLYFLEAKHMKISGGGQNKQIVELIEILRERPRKPEHHFAGFLDGIYFNKLFSGESPANRDEANKINQQRRDILKALRKNGTNYFVNTAGFKRLFV